MRVLTKPFGEIEVSEKQCLDFPYGIFGFEETRRYVLLDSSKPPFYWLQSLERPSLAFILLDPRVLVPDYRLDIADEELEEIGIRDPGEVLDFAIVTIPADPRQMTANLQGPIVVNRRTRAARQCISRNAEYGVRHRLMDDGGSGGGC
jgi:flagellar assembly factor FliW